MNNQYIIPLFVAGSLLLTLFAFFLIAYLLVQKSKQNSYQLERRQMKFDHDKKLLDSKIKEQERMMGQISQELHDNVMQQLCGVQMSMRVVNDLVTNNEQSVRIGETITHMDDIIEELRYFSHSLTGNFALKLGLIDTIKKDLSRLKRVKKINYGLEIVGDQYQISLSAEEELNIYRIAQETIQNCLKHANATNINFTLSYEPERFVMKISDDGVGFDMNKVVEMKGAGFQNIYERAERIGGNLDVQSAPEQGSTIILTLNPKENGIDS
jgi:two-component system NarL family sensor kinase